MKPYYDDGKGITIYCADSDDVLPLLAPESVALILTDPPYNVSVRSGRTNTTIGKIKRKHVSVGARADGSESYREIRRDFGEWDHDWDPEPFLREAPRLLQAGGSLVAFTSEFLIAAYLASGLDHRSLLHWRKTNPAPNFRGLYQRSIEMAVWQTKGGKWTFNAGGATPNCVNAPDPENCIDANIVSGWHVQNTGEKRIHQNQKPERVMRHYITIHSNPGDLILDPYMGSGTTLRAAKDLGRRCIGIDIDEAMCEKVAKRLSQEVFALAWDGAEGAAG